MSSTSTSTSTALIQTVLNYKEVLEKEIAKASLNEAAIDVDRCNDIFEQLQPQQI